MVRPDQRQLNRLQGVAIDFLNPAHGFMATSGGTLRSTEDGGRTWQAVSSGPRFVSLSFVSPRAGFALTARGRVEVTRDAGRSWRSVHAFSVGPDGGPVGGAIEFVDTEHGWASPTGESVFRTMDGGATWSHLRLPCSHTVVATSFADDANGLLVCGGGAGAGQQEKDLYATADGGRTWSHRACTSGYGPGCKNSLPGSGYVGRLAFEDPQTGLLATDRGGIWRSRDGGRHWAETLLTDDAWFVVSMSWASSRTVFALTGSDGSLVRSDDSGVHWRRVSPHGAGPPTGAISFSSPARGIGIGSGRILVPAGISATDDGGVTWRHVADLGDVVDSQLARAGPKIVWALGYRAPPSGTTRYFLIRSADEGRSWQRMLKPAGLGIGATLSFPTSQAGYLADGRRLFRTRDGGRSWELVRTSGQDLRGAVFVTPGRGLLIRDDALYRSDDEGRSWKAVPVIPSGRLLALSVLDPRHWWLETPNYLLRTADGGRSWTAIRLEGFDPKSIVFATPSVGYARGFEGGLYRTRDGGRTWRFVPAR